jgi:Protein of unknown function (DUF1194)
MGMLKLFVASTIILLAFTPELSRPSVDVALVIAADVSYSMDSEDQRVQREGYVRAFLDREIIEASRSGPLGRIAVTYVEWGGSAVQVVPWTIVDGAPGARRFAAELARQPLRRISFTSISNSLAFSRDLIRSSGFNATRRVIDISGDGPNNAGAPVPVARDAAVAQGIVIDGLPLMLRTASSTIPDLDLYYRNCVIGGYGSFVLAVTDVARLAEAIRRKLLTEISGPRLTRELPDERSLARAGYSGYDCLIGEELEERAIGR